MIEKLKSFKLFAIIAALALVIAIPVTVLQLQKQQETRSRASGGAISLYFSPQEQNVAVGGDFSVKVKLRGSDNNISAVDLNFTYDSNLLEFTSFMPLSTFTTITNTHTLGSVHFVGVNPTSNPITGSGIDLGILNFKGKAPGVATVGFSNIHVNASGVASALPIDTENTKNGIYTIITGDPLPSITISPTTTDPTPTFCVTPTPPLCLTGQVLTRDSSDNNPCGPRYICANPTPSSGTYLKFQIEMAGIGSSSAQGKNMNPKNPQRALEIEIYDASATRVYLGTTNITFNQPSGKYIGEADLGNFPATPSGQYRVKARFNNTLFKALPQIITINKNSRTSLPPLSLIAGDFNGDNWLDIQDYTIFMSCLRGLDSCRNLSINSNQISNISQQIAKLFSYLGPNRKGD